MENTTNILNDHEILLAGLTKDLLEKLNKLINNISFSKKISFNYQLFPRKFSLKNFVMLIYL